MLAKIFLNLPPSHLRLGLVEAHNVNVTKTPSEYLNIIAREIAPILSKDWLYPDNLKKGIRNLLKSFGYHSSGINRPASEYLVKDLQIRGSFNSINNVVDINNYLSLIYHLPMSIIDLDKAGYNLCLRLGTEGEKYVFNKQGQEISLKNLLILAKNEGNYEAIASPIKDSQFTKITDQTRNVLAVIYTSNTITSENTLATILDRFCFLLKSWANAQETYWKIVEK